MPYTIISPDGKKWIVDCKFCGGTHLFDIHKCPAKPENKIVTDCKHCGGEHVWNIDKCPVNPRETSDQIFHCLYCGGDHEKDRDACPASHEMCDNCGKAGYFTSECERVRAAIERGDISASQ